MKPLRPIRARHVILAWLVIYFPWLPGYPLNRVLPDFPTTWVLDANVGLQYALVAFSLVILTGWVGQISLGQGAFVGVGAFTTALLARNFGIPFPANLPLVAVATAGVAALLGIVALRVRGLYLAVATLIFAWMADAWLFGQSWFVGEGGSSTIDNRVIGDPRGVTSFDFSNPNVMYLATLAALAACWYAAVNLRDSRTGRAFFAVRGSEMAAVSLGIDVTRYKLMAFALAGAICGVAGTLMMTDLRAASPVGFDFTRSLFFLGIAVIGGLQSLGGAVAAGLMFGALDEVFFRVSFLTGWLDVVTVALLMVVLLTYPGGLGALGPAASSRLGALHDRTLGPLLARMRARSEHGAELAAEAVEVVDARPEVEVTPAPGRRRGRKKAPAEDEIFAEVVDAEDGAADGAPAAGRLAWLKGVGARIPRPRRAARVSRRSIDLATAARAGRGLGPEELAILAAAAEPVDWHTADVGYELPKRRRDRELVLAAENVTVKFGGLTAVDDFSLEVREHEITALIGPNGAGKTTLFNAIAGLNEPTSGRIKVFGEDVTDYPVHVRAQMGVGRTFQLIQLFGQLTVFDNLLVGTHVQNETGLFSHLALTNSAIMAEAEARDRVRVVVEMLGLEEVADRKVAGLPFGILRQVEIGRALVTEAPLLMLDEPASGLDNAETDELMQLLKFIRSHLGITILLIEHDIRMVTACSDYMYVITRGKHLADGVPADIQRNPDVIAAYLGTAEAADADGSDDDDPDDGHPDEDDADVDEDTDSTVGAKR